MRLKKVEVRGDGNCGFYAIFESARIQGLNINQLSYTDDDGRHELGDIMPVQIDSDPLYEERETLQDLFSAFCRNTLQHFTNTDGEHVYSNALAQSFDSHTYLGEEQWANTFLTLLDQAHTTAAGFRKDIQDKDKFYHDCIKGDILLDKKKNIHFSYPDEKNETCINSKRAHFLKEMVKNISDNTSARKTLMTEPEVNALREIFETIGLNLDTNKTMSATGNTIYIYPVRDHYSCFVPVDEGDELEQKINEANALFLLKKEKQRDEDAKLASSLSWAYNFSKQKEADLARFLASEQAERNKQISDDAALAQRLHTEEFERQTHRRRERALQQEMEALARQKDDQPLREEQIARQIQDDKSLAGLLHERELARQTNVNTHYSHENARNVEMPLARQFERPIDRPQIPVTKARPATKARPNSTRNATRRPRFHWIKRNNDWFKKKYSTLRGYWSRKKGGQSSRRRRTRKHTTFKKQHGRPL